MKLNIKIKMSEFEDLKPLIESIKKLELEKSPELNPEITIEWGE